MQYKGGLFHIRLNWFESPARHPEKNSAQKQRADERADQKRDICVISARSPTDRNIVLHARLHAGLHVVPQQEQRCYTSEN